MAVHIKLIRNNIKSSSSYGKYFAKTVSQGEVTLKDMVSDALMARGYDKAAASRAATSSTTSATASPPSGSTASSRN